MNEIGLAGFGGGERLLTRTGAPNWRQRALAALKSLVEPQDARGWANFFWLLAIVSGIYGVLAFVAFHDKETSAVYVARFLLGMGRHDSWQPMAEAIEHLRANPNVPLYSQLFFDEHTKFQYPISSLLFLDLVQRATGFAWPRVIAIFNWGSWVAVWGVGLTSWRLFAGGLQNRDETSRRDQFLLAGATVALTLFFYPLSRSYVLGQIQTSMTLLVALALLAWRADRKWLAGICVGLCCAIKPQWAMLLLWGVLRREWEMVAAALGVAAVLLFGAGALYGFEHYLDYLPVLTFISHHGESYFPNQSINGLMNRLFDTGNNTFWVGDAFPAYIPIVYITTLVSGIALLATALLYRRGERASTIDLALMMLSLTMASPIAWEHHYGVLLPILAIAAPAALQRQALGRYTWAVLLAAFVLASGRYDAVNRLADTPFNPLQSYLLFGAALTLLLLYRIQAKPQAAASYITAAAASPDATLCVDLDGTLIRTDILLESLMAACRSWRTLRCLPRLLLSGKAGLKAGLASSCSIACESLPFNAEVVDYLREEKTRGRHLVLVTATNRDIALRINRHLDNLFDEVIGSDAALNLRGATKAEALVSRFGEHGFVYIGNDRTDLHVWRRAGGAMVVGGSRGLIADAAREARIERLFAAPASRLKAVIKEIRPQQWLKNMLVFVPILTSGDLFNWTAWIAAAVTFGAFCLIASSIYMVNDLLDLDADRAHPRKRRRPLASGAMPVAWALALVPMMLLAGSALALWAGVLGYVLGYAVMSIAYSARFKEMPLVDVFLLAALYSIRLYAGGVATIHEVSLWLMAFSGFLFLALAMMKRVTELSDLRSRGGVFVSRRGYNVSDQQILTSFGTASSFVSALVLALYVQSDAAMALGSNQHALWAIVPLLLFWQLRLWLATARGYMPDDPIVYTAKDWVSALVAASLMGTLVFAHTVF